MLKGPTGKEATSHSLAQASVLGGGGGHGSVSPKRSKKFSQITAAKDDPNDKWKTTIKKLVSKAQQEQDEESAKRLALIKDARKAKASVSGLEEKTKNLDYIYRYDPPTELSSVENREGDALERRVCDPYVSQEDVEEKDVVEIVSINSCKRLKVISGRCSVRLEDGTEIIGSWRGGVRQGQGSLMSPQLESLGITMLTGNYQDGYLTGVGRLHMQDGSVREGWFLNGFADGPFKGDVKVRPVLTSGW